MLSSFLSVVAPLHSMPCSLPAPLFSAVDGSSRSLASRERVHKKSVSVAGHGTSLSSVALRQKGG